MVNTMGSKYPAISIDNYWGSTLTIDLYNVDAVLDYLLNFVGGSFTGGTSPAWTYSKTNPIITGIRVKANNQTIRDVDGAMLNEYMYQTRGTAADGANFDIPMTDIQYSLKKRILNTLFPSYAFTQNKLYLDFAALDSVTSGSPTGTSGAQILLQEQVLSRATVNFKLYDFRMIEISQALSINGSNSLTNFLSTDAFYKSVMYFCSTSDTTPYTAGSDSVISDIQLIINLRQTLKDAYWQGLKSQNQTLFGKAMDTGFALEVFMEDNDLTQLLPLNNPTIVKSANLQVNTTASTGYLYALKNIYVE